MNKTNGVSSFGHDAFLSGKVEKGTRASCRAARTRGRLQHALRVLIEAKDYESIGIEEICSAAGVGRSTFYIHYSGKDDLKRASLDHLRNALVHRQQDALAGPPENDARLSFSLPMFEHAREHLDLYRALVGTRGCSHRGASANNTCCVSTARHL